MSDIGLGIAKFAEGFAGSFFRGKQQRAEREAKEALARIRQTELDLKVRQELIDLSDSASPQEVALRYNTLIRARGGDPNSPEHRDNLKFFQDQVINRNADLKDFLLNSFKGAEVGEISTGITQVARGNLPLTDLMNQLSISSQRAATAQAIGQTERDVRVSPPGEGPDEASARLQMDKFDKVAGILESQGRTDEAEKFRQRAQRIRENVGRPVSTTPFTTAAGQQAVGQTFLTGPGRRTEFGEKEETFSLGEARVSAILKAIGAPDIESMTRPQAQQFVDILSKTDPISAEMRSLFQRAREEEEEKESSKSFIDFLTGN